jgi:predicted Zn-dependent protease
MNSVKQAVYQLAKKENLYNTKDSPIVATNAIEPMLHYLKTINPRIKCDYIRYYQRYDKPWDYAIIYNRFIDKSLLQNNYYPPANTIITIKAEHSPICVVVKKSPASEDACKAMQYLTAKDYNNAAVYYQKALTEDPNNETGYSNLAVALANTGRIDAAIDALNRELKFTPQSIETYDLLSRLYKAKGDNAHAQEAANTAQSIYQQEKGDSDDE